MATCHKLLLHHKLAVDDARALLSGPIWLLFPSPLMRDFNLVSVNLFYRPSPYGSSQDQQLPYPVHPYRYVSKFLALGVHLAPRVVISIQTWNHFYLYHLSFSTHTRHECLLR
jgi:hypothetical protein